MSDTGYSDVSYHIESKRSFKELPDRILVREDGWLGGWKFYGEPVVDYWYVRERTTTRNGKTRKRYGRIIPLCECCGYAIGDERYHYCPSCGAKVVDE